MVCYMLRCCDRSRFELGFRSQNEFTGDLTFIDNVNNVAVILGSCRIHKKIETRGFWWRKD